MIRLAAVVLKIQQHQDARCPPWFCQVNDYDVATKKAGYATSAHIQPYL